MTTKELQEYWRNEKRQCKQIKLLFEIPSTRIVEHHLSKYVMYKIIILQTGSFDSNKSVIERRNFTEEIINERKLAFKDYLRLLYSMKYIRRSKKFIDFLTRPELQEAYGCLRGGQYTKALEILLEVVGLQERLTRGNPAAIVPTLCAIVVCHKDLENAASAFEYGEKALSRLRVHTSHRYYIPLLDTMITLAYELGKDFLSLQEKLEEWKTKKDPVRVFTLKELAVREYVRIKTGLAALGEAPEVPSASQLICAVGLSSGPALASAGSLLDLHWTWGSFWQLLTEATSGDPP
ncbi:hypothetical protein DUI87_14090 [Hirundo rustica rustica]|uniref:PX domain-containing protein n=1 Tax=Hirundo rustica rustica TaxID=333673 RepID=A0A3M0KCW6_HIRRU|nr:hypothetical protein DUI87_14090 [Hirundo rustica rustica]